MDRIDIWHDLPSHRDIQGYSKPKSFSHLVAGCEYRSRLIHGVRTSDRRRHSQRPPAHLRRVVAAGAAPPPLLQRLTCTEARLRFAILGEPNHCRFIAAKSASAGAGIRWYSGDVISRCWSTIATADVEDVA